jgi:hypothetical protein
VRGRCMAVIRNKEQLAVSREQRWAELTRGRCMAAVWEKEQLAGMWVVRGGAGTYCEWVPFTLNGGLSPLAAMDSGLLREGQGAGRRCGWAVGCGQSLPVVVV